MIYDAIVIGAGPAGLMAAKALKEKNANFICIESRKKIGMPLRCGEGIRKEDFVGLFGHTNYNFVLNEVEGHKIIYSKERIIHEPYLELDKPKFEQWLAKDIIKQIYLDTICTGISVKDDGVEILTSRGKKKAKIAIITTGSGFVLQKRLGLLKKYPETIACYGGIYSNGHLDRKKFYYYFDKSGIGYFWAFPKDEGRLNLGYGGSSENLKEKFERLLNKNGFSDAKPIVNFGGIIPVTGPIEKTYRERILVAGMAAGLVHAGSGEGNIFALKSGMMAGHVAAEAIKQDNFSREFLKRYEAEWKKALWPRLEAGMALYELQKFGIRFGILEKLFNLPSEKSLQKFLFNRLSFKIRAIWKIVRLFGLQKLKNYP